MEEERAESEKGDGVLCLKLAFPVLPAWVCDVSADRSVGEHTRDRKVLTRQGRSGNLALLSTQHTETLYNDAATSGRGLGARADAFQSCVCPSSLWWHIEGPTNRVTMTLNRCFDILTRGQGPPEGLAMCFWF